jgi:AbiV family abortive infection protein
MTEDEIIAWLSQPLARIVRDRVLSRGEVAEVVTAYLGNGLDLFEEALLLSTHQKISRAAALAVLGLEEIAKIPRIVDTFLRFEHGVEDAWTAYWKTGGKPGGVHKAKQAAILAYGQLIQEKDYLYRYNRPKNIVETLDTFKQSNFYVDLRQDGVHAPADDQWNRGALDYLLTFGQERADSFCGWHISVRRSVDYLRRRPVDQWTTHYALLEVRADILYQVAALSAARVPDYVTFCDFAEQYEQKIPNDMFQEALLSLATLLKSRVRQSSNVLPLYYARYDNAFKLMVCLADPRMIPNQREIVDRRFGEKLRETLLSHDTERPRS